MTGRRLAVHTGMAAIRAYELELFGRLVDGLAGIPGVRLWGIADRARFEERTPTAALTIEGVTAERASTFLGDRGIATWWGDFYATGLIERLGLRAGGRPAHRADALQHRRGDRPAPDRARGHRERGRDRGMTSIAPAA